MLTILNSSAGSTLSRAVLLYSVRWILCWYGVSKCTVVNYTRKKSYILNNYTMGEIVLTRQTESEDFDIVFDHRLTFVQYVNHLPATASKMYGFILRNCKYFSNSRTIISLFNAFVRNSPELGSIIWNPLYECHRNHIEGVQRSFSKYLVFREEGVYPYSGFDHTALSCRFGAVELKVRRGVACLRFLHRVLNGNMDCSTLLVFYMLPCSSLWFQICPSVWAFCAKNKCVSVVTFAFDVLKIKWDLQSLWYSLQ